MDFFFPWGNLNFSFQFNISLTFPFRPSAQIGWDIPELIAGLPQAACISSCEYCLFQSRKTPQVRYHSRWQYKCPVLAGKVKLDCSTCSHLVMSWFTAPEHLTVSFLSSHLPQVSLQMLLEGTGKLWDHEINGKRVKRGKNLLKRYFQIHYSKPYATCTFVAVIQVDFQRFMVTDLHFNIQVNLLWR